MTSGSSLLQLLSCWNLDWQQSSIGSYSSLQAALSYSYNYLPDSGKCFLSLPSIPGAECKWLSAVTSSEMLHHPLWMSLSSVCIFVNSLVFELPQLWLLSVQADYFGRDPDWYGIQHRRVKWLAQSHTNGVLVKAMLVAIRYKLLYLSDFNRDT